MERTHNRSEILFWYVFLCVGRDMCIDMCMSISMRCTLGVHPRLIRLSRHHRRTVFPTPSFPIINMIAREISGFCRLFILVLLLLSQLLDKSNLDELIRGQIQGLNLTSRVFSQPQKGSESDATEKRGTVGDAHLFLADHVDDLTVICALKFCQLGRHLQRLDAMSFRRLFFFAGSRLGRGGTARPIFRGNLDSCCLAGFWLGAFAKGIIADLFKTSIPRS